MYKHLLLLCTAIDRRISLQLRFNVDAGINFYEPTDSHYHEEFMFQRNLMPNTGLLARNSNNINARATLSYQIF
jgi:hypothetical protein